MNLSFADYVIEKMSPVDRFLEELEKKIPWEEIERRLNEKIHRSNKGRPPYSLLLLFKMLLLKTFYSISDESTEFLCRDRLSFRRFLNLRIEDSTPDATTLENFRHDLEDSQLLDELIEWINLHCEKMGYKIKSGSLIDATFIRANSRPTKSSEKSDPNAEFGHKGYGYSGHVNVDLDSKMIQKVHVTPANIADLDGLADTIHERDNEIMADRGYDCQKNRKLLDSMGIANGIMKKRRKGEEKLPLFEKLRNKAISRFRAKAEHIFATFKCVFGFVRASYRGLKKGYCSD